MLNVMISSYTCKPVSQDKTKLPAYEVVYLEFNIYIFILENLLAQRVYTAVAIMIFIASIYKYYILLAMTMQISLKNIFENIGDKTN